MNKIKKIFEKIKRYFKRIFNRQNTKLIEESTINNVNKDINNDEFIDEKKKQKEEFFTLYNNVKNGTINVNNLMINDLIKVQLKMKKEIGILDEKINQKENEVNVQNTEINILNREKEKNEKSSKRSS